MTKLKIRVTAEQLQSLLTDVRKVLDHPTHSCLSDEEFTGYTLDTLSADDKARIDIHLADCTECATQMERLVEEAEAWRGEQGEVRLVELSRRIQDELRRSERGVALTLTQKAGWWWVSASKTLDRALTELDSAAERVVGTWRLMVAPRFASGFRLNEEVKPALALSLALPDAAGLIRLRVIPEYVTTEHTYRWQMTIELDTDSRLQGLIVGIGDALGATQTMTLRAGQEWTIHAEPPGKEMYWFHFSWPAETAVSGDWREHKVELPLYFDPVDE